MRRRRNEVTIELRKNKREETLQKRRNVPIVDSTGMKVVLQIFFLIFMLMALIPPPLKCLNVL